MGSKAARRIKKSATHAGSPRTPAQSSEYASDLPVVDLAKDPVVDLAKGPVLDPAKDPVVDLAKDPVLDPAKDPHDAP